MRTRSLVACVLLLGLCNLGCSSDEPSGGDVVAPIDALAEDGTDTWLDASADGADVAEDPMQRIVRVTCEKMAECGAAALTIYTGDLEGCIAREYETMKLLPDLPGFVIDLKISADAVVSSSCAEFTRRSALEVLPSGIQGTLPDGEPCVHPLQCASHVCARLLGTSCGSCASPLASGAACDDSYLLGSPCGVGSTCVGGKCVALGDIGAACDPASAPCFSDLGCVDGLCGLPKQAEQPCTLLAGECDLYSSGLACHPLLKKCTAFDFVGVGEQCGVTPTGGSVCTLGNCYPSLMNGTCMAQAADGDSCDTTVGPDCQFHAQCVNGKCEQFFAPVCR
jgi:hypothetical protein